MSISDIERIWRKQGPVCIDSRRVDGHCNVFFRSARREIYLLYYNINCIYIYDLNVTDHASFLGYAAAEGRGGEKTEKTEIKTK